MMSLQRMFSVLVRIFVFTFLTGLAYPLPSVARSARPTQALSLPENLVVCTRIAFTVTTYPEGQMFANTDIYTVDATGESLHRITNSPTQELSPTWGPNGRQIAYIASGEKGIVVTEVDGTEQRLWIDYDTMNSWAEHEVRAVSLAWFPTGKLAVETSHYADTGVLQFEIFVTRTGNDVQYVTQGTFPSWKPDGNQLVFSSVPQNDAGNFELYQVNLQTGKVTRLTYQKGYDTFPALSPDGTRIAFISTRHDPYKGLPESYAERELYVMNADGTHVTRLTYDDVTDGSPTWSPDGEWLAFRHVGGLYIIRADGTQMHKLVDAARMGGQVDTPVWSPWLCGDHASLETQRSTTPIPPSE